MFRKLWLTIGKLWCSLAHRSVMWPVHGHYECRRCGRCFPAFVETPLRAAASLMLAAALVFLIAPAHAAAISKPHTSAEADAVLDRFLAAGPSAPWAIESVEIHACLPKLEKTGQLKAIRRLDSATQTSFSLLQVDGDRTVEQQVMVRYLDVNQRTPAGPAALTAMTPANYKFTYKGLADDGERSGYVFQVSPRHKREGLIKGELWLDPVTALPVHESGRLVKSPLRSIRRVSITREFDVRDGLVASRLTHIRCKARRVGKAELVVEELPIAPPAGE